ncbi:MAG: 2OG-Fe(II) oxygenase [Gammaproteobacteria bacterium]|jgi:hypothetical protein
MSLHDAASTDLPANVHLVFSRRAGMLTTALLRGFMSHRKNTDIRRTHLFNGRYENIYLTSEHIPQITDLLDQACDHASRILGIDDLQAGCWFNHMPPGAVTTPHSHDDDDELLSAVFYVSVPPDSGQLIIHADNNPYSITPQQGLFVFFAPDVVHEVSENASATDRLSIGINFGRRQRADF